MAKIFRPALLALALAAQLSRASAQDTRPLSYESPAYPPLARQARIAGTVILGFAIDPDGTPSSIEIVSGHRTLAAAARESLSRWRFAVRSPRATLDNQRVTYIFELSGDSADGYYDPKKERAVLEGPSLIRVRATPAGTLHARNCPGEPAAAPPGPVLAAHSVTLGRTGCYGNCPSYEVTLYGDGRVHWKGNGFVDITGERAYQIDADLAASLLLRFRAPEVLSLCGDYSRSVTDNPSTATTIASSTDRKVIHDYASSSPEWFRQLQLELEDVAQTHSMRHGDPVTEPLIRIQSEYLSKPGLTDLMRAAARKDLVSLKRLLAAGARLEDTDASGWTALMYAAASYSSGQAVDELLRAGANPNHRSPFGDTVLMASALNGEFAGDLAERSKTLINAQNRDGVTALMFLAASGRVDEIRAALQAGADAKLKDRQGRTALAYLDAIPCHKSLLRGHEQSMIGTLPCSNPDEELQKARRLLTPPGHP